MPGSPTRDLPANSFDVVLALALVFTVALSLAWMAGHFTRRLLASIDGGREHATLSRTTARLVRTLVFGLSAIVMAIPALEFAGIDLGVGLSDQEVTRWAARTAARAATVLILALTTNRIAAAMIGRAEREVLVGDDPAQVERRRRGQTVATTLRRVLSTLIWTVAVLMILRQLDVDISPVLTGAGVLGLGIGFGAQTLVKDVISGIFILVEDQVRVGDAADINGISGIVEQISLRTIVLRDIEGTVYTISNSAIQTVANRSKDFSYYLIDLAVDHADDTDHIVDAVRDSAAELQTDPAFGPHILEPLEVLGVDNFTASQVTLRVRIKTRPLKQWEVGRELRRRIKKTFAARGIQMPPPQMAVTLHTAASREP